LSDVVVERVSRLKKTLSRYWSVLG